MNKIEISVNNEISLLLSIINHPENYKKDKSIFLNILKNQTNLANYKKIELKIKSYSLNSHKLYVEKYTKYSFVEFDFLRKKAYTALKTIKSENSQKEIKYNEIKPSVNIFLKNNLLLNSIILTLIEKLGVYAFKSKNEELINDYKYQLNQIKKIMSELNEL